MIDELIEKWEDVRDCTEEYVDRVLIEEFLEDLREIRRYVN